MSDILASADSVPPNSNGKPEELPSKQVLDAAKQASKVAEQAKSALDGVKALKGDVSRIGASVDGIREEMREMFASLREGMAQSKPQTEATKAPVKGRVLSDDELAGLVERMSSDDAAQLHVLIAAKAESELWAARGISPATHVIATEPVKLMYDGKVTRTVVGEAYERAKFVPADLLQFGDTYFSAPKLTK
jgi:hypothetical protein